MNFRNTRFILLLVLLSILAASVLPAAAQNDEGVCSTKPTLQARFLNFNDIPAYALEANADEASAILSGAVIADQIPTPDVRIRGGDRQKYLVCGAFAEGDGSVRVIIGHRTLAWVPEHMIADIVARNLRDDQPN
jgi:hypothetical protein